MIAPTCPRASAPERPTRIYRRPWEPALQRPTPMCRCPGVLALKPGTPMYRYRRTALPAVDTRLLAVRQLAQVTEQLSTRRGGLPLSLFTLVLPDYLPKLLAICMGMAGKHQRYAFPGPGQHSVAQPFDFVELVGGRAGMGVERCKRSLNGLRINAAHQFADILQGAFAGAVASNAPGLLESGQQLGLLQWQCLELRRAQLE